MIDVTQDQRHRFGIAARSRHLFAESFVKSPVVVEAGHPIAECKERELSVHPFQFAIGREKLASTLVEALGQKLFLGHELVVLDPQFLNKTPVLAIKLVKSR